MSTTGPSSISPAREDASPSRVNHEAVLLSLRRIMRAMDSHSRYLAQHHGLTGPQALVLRELFRLGDMPAGQLARTVSLSQATLTGILDRLAKKGLLERRRDSRDRRRVLVHLTAAGVALLQSPPPLFKETFLRQFASLQDWEQGLLLSSLQRIAAMMETAGDLQVRAGLMEAKEEG